ncbi:MAG: TrmH family RNA methyltransferase [Flexilinea sp.]
MITSKSNSRIKEIRCLKDSKALKKSDLFYMEGLRIIGEAIDKGSEIETIILCPEILKADFGSQLVARAEKLNIEILEVSENVFESFAHKENPQGLAAIGKQRFKNLDQLNVTTGIVVALSEVADPGNLGTIIRTADAVGCEGIILLGDSVNPYELNAIRGSMGAIFSQSIIKTDFEILLDWKKTRGLQLVGTSDKAADGYAGINYQNPLILLMGSERQGLNDKEIKSCDIIARIPMKGSSDSLNLAVATGVMLYQIFNVQRNRE